MSNEHQPTTKEREAQFGNSAVENAAGLITEIPDPLDRISAIVDLRDVLDDLFVGAMQEFTRNEQAAKQADGEQE